MSEAIADLKDVGLRIDFLLSLREATRRSYRVLQQQDDIFHSRGMSIRDRHSPGMEDVAALGSRSRLRLLRNDNREETQSTIEMAEREGASGIGDLRLRID